MFHIRVCSNTTRAIIISLMLWQSGWCGSASGLCSGQCFRFLFWPNVLATVALKISMSHLLLATVMIFKQFFIGPQLPTSYCEDLIHGGIRRLFYGSKLTLEIAVRMTVSGFQFSLPKWSLVREFSWSNIFSIHQAQQAFVYVTIQWIIQMNLWRILCSRSMPNQ